ncbi:MAG: bifunctional nuclease family protein [Thermoanaerobaculia bacterium]|nr:bifunctional nuclease family protein [Thermoanaerobaculia bacterium]
MHSSEHRPDLPPTDDLVPVEVRGLVVDPRTRVPIVILHDVAGHRLLPIWIGPFEAIAITTHLEGVEAPRPMTHDLLRSVVGQLEGSVDRVVISDLSENVFYAILWGHRSNQSLFQVDCRPSDAIALALRFQASIFVHRKVLENARAINLVSELSDEEQLASWLDAIDPSDFGEYTM